MNKAKFKGEVELISKEIEEYYETSFPLAIEEYEYNKKLKNKIKNLLINAVESNNSDNKNYYINSCLVLLGKNTGCAEDAQILDEIIDELLMKEVLVQSDLSILSDSLAINRWI